MNPSDGELIIRILNGDNKAFDELFYRYQAQVYRFVIYLIGNKSESEDLFQETWLRVVKNIQTLNKPTNLKSWIFTIAVNLHRDELRKKKIRRLFFVSKSIEFDSNEDELSNYLETMDKTVMDNKSADIEFFLSLQKAIRKLPSRQQEVFLLKEIEGFKHHEISKMLKIPEGTVRSLLHRALKFLQKELAEFEIK